LKHTTTEQSKPADEEKAPSGRDSCPICLELILRDNLIRYKSCCGNVFCAECSKKCKETSQNCPLCRVPAPKTEAEEFARLQLRVAKGDKVAQYILGVAYEFGRHGLKKSMKRAVKLYELSAALGHAGAQNNLGTCFYRGSGVKLDKKKALKYFKLACEQNYAEAQYNLGVMYYCGDGTERDVEKALNFFELAAASGNPDAQSMLGTIRGANVKR